MPRTPAVGRSKAQDRPGVSGCQADCQSALQVFLSVNDNGANHGRVTGEIVDLPAEAFVLSGVPLKAMGKVLLGTADVQVESRRE